MMNMVLKEVEIGLLKVNPENKKYFTDIKLKSPDFWKSFVSNVAEQGILEPVVVNREKMRIISGHQRVLAAKENGMEKIPCLLVDEVGEEDELQRLLSANVFRRQLDAIEMMRLMGVYRESYEKRREVLPAGETLPDVYAEMTKVFGKGHEFISAADLFNALPKKKQKELTEWVKENDPTDRELKEQVENARVDSLTDDKTIKGLKAKIEEMDKETKKLQKSLAGVTTKESIEKFKKKIAQLAREKRDLKKALAAKDTEDRSAAKETTKMIRASKLIEEIQTAATSTAAKINSFMELMDDAESLGGLDMAITQERVKELLSTIKAFVERWSRKTVSTQRRIA